MDQQSLAQFYSAARPHIHEPCKSRVIDFIMSVRLFYGYLVGEQSESDSAFENHVLGALMKLTNCKPITVSDGNTIIGTVMPINNCEKCKTTYLVYCKNNNWFFGVQVKCNNVVQTDFRCSISELEESQLVIHDLLSKALHKTGLKSE